MDYVVTLKRYQVPIPSPTGFTVGGLMQCWRLIVFLSHVCYVHQLRFEPVDESTQGNATFPRRCQICDRHIPVALRLFLAPGKKPRWSNLRLYK